MKAQTLFLATLPLIFSRLTILHEFTAIKTGLFVIGCYENLGLVGWYVYKLRFQHQSNLDLVIAEVAVLVPLSHFF